MRNMRRSGSAASHGYRERARNRRRGEFAQALVALVRDHLHPRIVRRQHGMDLVQRHILLEFDGESLAVAAHSADTHADAVDRDRPLGTPEDLVGLGLALPLLLRLAAIELLVY